MTFFGHSNQAEAYVQDLMVATEGTRRVEMQEQAVARDAGPADFDFPKPHLLLESSNCFVEKTCQVTIKKKEQF